ncbi:putative Gar1/Naf1 RNA binding region [Trypanosoma cruzi]|nr:putative Gar1/Naf1 RNA binding region [Trypanosoma cruzi]
MDASSVGSSCELAEDVRGVRRQRVSLSSVDSEPIIRRHRPDASPRYDDAAAADDDDDADDDAGDDDRNTNGLRERDEGKGSDVLSEGQMTAAHREGSPSALVQAALRDANGEPLLQIPMERVSEATVASVTGLIARSSTVVADNVSGAFVMDAGTRLCLGDGSVVGVITTVMGPVSCCAYAIVCLPAVFGALCDGGKLTVGVDLCYDLGEQSVIYDPVSQCDMRRGTDASYVNDEELPPHARPDFSDDEAERQWKMSRRMSADGEPISSDDDPVDVDWEKIDVLEACLRDERREGTPGVDTAAPRHNPRLVVPPWVATTRAPNGAP